MIPTGIKVIAIVCWILVTTFAKNICLNRLAMSELLYAKVSGCASHERL
jgi:hypothetical protein